MNVITMWLPVLLLSIPKLTLLYVFDDAISILHIIMLVCIILQFMVYYIILGPSPITNWSGAATLHSYPHILKKIIICSFLWASGV